MQSSNFIVCSKIDFVIKANEEVEIFIVEFESRCIGSHTFLLVKSKFGGHSKHGVKLSYTN